MSAKLAMQPTRRPGSNVKLTVYEEKLFEMSKTMRTRDIAAALGVKQNTISCRLSLIREKVRTASY